jgi:Transposase DDE domain
MNEFAGAYGDERRAAAVARLSQQIVSRGSVVIRAVGGSRNGELAAHRVLGSCHVTPRETVACVAQQTARACAGRRVVVPQDTTEVNFPGRISRGLGGAGRLGETPGFFIHAAIAVDADEEAVLGLVAAQIWNRREHQPMPRRQRDISAKEPQRWLRAAEQAGERLSEASQIIMVGDRENDIYQAFARRPDNVEQIIRAAQDRALAGGGKLFAAPAVWGELAQQTVSVPSRGPGDKGRQATVSLRAGPIRLCRPLHGRNGNTPPEVALHLVEAREIAPPSGVQPLHWRLLTTLAVQTAADAADVVRLYRLRWRIEQTFRTLKSDGLKLEECQTQDPWRLLNLSALALDAAVKTIQLVDARDGSDRPASDVASKAEIAAARAICPTLEGTTPRQRNPHPDGSLASLSWVVARLGGWNCYYKPPGPKTMRRGWDRLKAIAIGFSLKRRGKNVRIP